MMRWECVARQSSILQLGSAVPPGGQRRQAQLEGPKGVPERSVAGWQVGLQGTEKGQLEVWFGRLLLGP